MNQLTTQESVHSRIEGEADKSPRQKRKGRMTEAQEETRQSGDESDVNPREVRQDSSDQATESVQYTCVGKKKSIIRATTTIIYC